MAVFRGGVHAGSAMIDKALVVTVVASLSAPLLGIALFMVLQGL